MAGSHDSFAANNSDRVIDNLPHHLFQALFDHAVDGLIVLDSHRKVVYMNQAAVYLTGGETRAVGLHCGTLLQCHTEENQPLQFNGCFGECVLASGHPMTDIEMNIISQSGDTVPVAVSYSYVPAENDENYLLMSLRNISDKKRLDKELRQKEELRYTLQERERLARDLHDGVVQDIAYANMQTKLLVDDLQEQQVDAATNLQRISDILEQSFLELRQAIYDLTYRVSEDVHNYIQQYVIDFQTRTGIQASYRHHNVPSKVAPFIANQTSKILQESLANIRKHAGASQIYVDLHFNPKLGILTLCIADNGCGFEAMATKDGDHFGMKTMRERAELMGAQLLVHSTVGHGTEIKLDIPMD